MSDSAERKWCTYCRASTHNDSECWCTREVGWRPPTVGAFNIASAKLIPPVVTAAQCFCIGPQRGEPRCPCAMRGVFRRDGRWIQAEVDLGPVAGHSAAPKATGEAA